MRKDGRLEALSAVPLFANCTKKELGAIARLCTALEVEAGSALTTQGSRGQECFIIADGEAKVVVNKRTVATVGPGDCVGELALLDGGSRTATVTARTPMSLFVLSVPEFNALLDASPGTARRILVGMAKRLRAAEAKRPH
jgi:CRP/FNR family cyclic AMP-dependent transcriptional regulator